MCSFDVSLIMRRMTEIKRNKNDYYDANIFSLPNAITQYEDNDHAIAFSVKDRDIIRIYFAANDSEQLTSILTKFPVHSGIEIISKTINKETEEAIRKSGFIKENVYLRGMNNNLRELLHKNIPEKYQNVDVTQYAQPATPEDADDIYEYIHDVFDPLMDHLQTREEVLCDINNGTYLIYRDDGYLTTICKYVIQGKRVYMEYAANRGESINMHSLYLAGLEDAVKKGINVACNWVREDNARSLAFCKRFGIVPDGTSNYIFIKRDL